VFIGLNLTWAIVTIVVGNLIGALFMAYHSVQGPRLGVPQMIQSRAQFGFLGALLPIAVTILIYLGFAVEGGLVAGDALASWLAISQTLGIVIFNVALMLVALVGHDLIHRASRVISVISVIVFAALFINLVGHVGSVHVHGHDSWQNILLVISIVVAWQVTWAPYVSDYSRYLPVDTPGAATFWTTYLGAVVGGAWAMIIGAFAALLAPAAIDADTIGYLAGRLHAVRPLIIIALLLGLVPAQAEGPLRRVPHRPGRGVGAGARRVDGGGADRLRDRVHDRRHRVGRRGGRSPGDDLREHHAVPALPAGAVDGDQPDRLLPRPSWSVRHPGTVRAPRTVRTHQLAVGAALPDHDRDRDPVRQRHPAGGADRQGAWGCRHRLDHRPDPAVSGLLAAGAGAARARSAARARPQPLDRPTPASLRRAAR
jgi:hypothetical protein